MLRGLSFFGLSIVIGAVAVSACATTADIVPPDDDSGMMMMQTDSGAPCTMCGGNCADLKTDGMNCGKCGTVCPMGATCVQGSCQCASGQSKCNNTCVDTKTDLNNCGKCGMACGGGDAGMIMGGGSWGCANGSCSIICPMPKVECTGACVDTQTDIDNCGMCSNACDPMTEQCSQGLCCKMGESVCNNMCTQTQSDPMNCGKCGMSCPMNMPACVNGMCSTALVYSHAFTQSQVPPMINCTDWLTFRQQASGNASSITIKGSNDNVGRTCTGNTAAQIVNALKAGGSFNGTCNNISWSVGTCVGGQDIGVSADGAICTCNGQYAVRPCINHQDWGGVKTVSCNAPSQTLTVTIQ
jgi:hypothetical protein